MNFTGLSKTLNLIKDQAIAHKEQIGFWLGRTVKPICEKILMANPILLTVGLAATAIFSVCYIVHNYRKNSRLENQVRQLRLDNEKNNKANQREYTNLNNQKMGWQQAATFSGNELQTQKIINVDLRSENNRKIQELSEESQLHVKTKTQLDNTMLKLNNAYVNIQNLEAKITSKEETIQYLTTTADHKDKEFEKLVHNYNELNLHYDGLESENAQLLNIIKTLNDSVDVSIPTETNFLGDILFLEEKKLRQKDMDLILDHSEIYLKYRTLPKINGLIAKLEDLIKKVQEDPDRLFNIQINKIDNWNEVEEIENPVANPDANPYADNVEIDEDEANLAGSTLNLLSNSMCLGKRALSEFELTNLHAYYKAFQEAIITGISEKPKQDVLSVEDQLILAFVNSKK